MKKQSLLEIKQAINEYLADKSEMEQQDRVELYINLNKFLEPKQYEENIKVLELHRRNKWKYIKSMDKFQHGNY